jgi:hypothetical protein
MPSLPDAKATPAARSRPPVLGAFLEGWRRVLRAPALAAGALAASFLLALPLGLVMQDALESHLGRSLEADQAAAGWNQGWAAEFGAQAQGIGRTFTYEFLGFGGTLAIVSDLADRQPLEPALAAAAAVSIALWVFLSGGLLDRFARGRPVSAGHFFGSCGVFFLRFLRLAVLAGAAYWALFRYLHPFLFGTVYHRLTRDMTQERDGIVLQTVLYFVLALAIALVNLAADFAKVRAVVEDRRSMLGAAGAALRFIRRRPFRVAGLCFLNAIAFLIILRLWLQMAPSATAAPWLALLATEVYLLLRVWAKLAFMASEVVFFQGELAHAAYTAAPPIVWPESPAAEAIGNLTRN